MNTAEKIKYRATKKWKDFRKVVLTHYGYSCFLCGIVKKGKASKGLQIHHIHPENYGNETMDDVCCLCTSCHQELERHLRRKVFNPIQYAENFLTLFKGQKNTPD